MYTDIRRQIILILALVLVLTVGLTGCGRRPRVDPTPTPTDVHDAAALQPPPDTGLREEPADLMLELRLINRLVMRGDAGFEPGIAEAYEMGEAGRVWTFFIREGIFTTEGHPVDSTIVQARLNSAFMALEFPFEGIEVIDDRTVVVILPEPRPDLLDFIERIVFNVEPVAG